MTSMFLFFYTIFFHAAYKIVVTTTEKKVQNMKLQLPLQLCKTPLQSGGNTSQ